VEDTMRESWAKVILKYFVHGLFFSLLITFLIIGSLFVGAALILVGGIFGLIALLVGLMVLFGVANNLINRAVWGDPMNWSILALLIHGLGLFVALIIVNCVIVLLPQLFFPGLITAIVMWIPTNILDGRVCRSIALRWLD
jgi:hypothetical protein